MNRWLFLLLALIMCLSLSACGGKTTTEGKTTTSEIVENESTEGTDDETATSQDTSLSKDEMLAEAIPMTKDEIDKSIGNMAYAKSLVGNTYTFGGEICSVEADHAVITFYITGESSNYTTAANVMVASLYLPSDELISLEVEQRFSFVGKLDDVSSREETIPDWGTQTVVDMVFKSAAIVSDRFEQTGKLHSQNTSYGDNAWNIEFSGNPYLTVVHFRDDVSTYKGQEITYSYRVTSEGVVDAYIVE